MAGFNHAMHGGREEIKRKLVKKFSLTRMYRHFQNGRGKPLYLNMSSLDFSGASQQMLGLENMVIGDVRDVNLFNLGVTNPIAIAYGRAARQFQGNNRFSIVSDGSASFNFSSLIDSNASLGRNLGNVLGAMINYNLLEPFPFPNPATPVIFGGPYNVIFVGTTVIPK